MKATGIDGERPPPAPLGEQLGVLGLLGSVPQRNSGWPLGLLPGGHAWGAFPGRRQEDILVKRPKPPLRILYFIPLSRTARPPE